MFDSMTLKCIPKSDAHMALLLAFSSCSSINKIAVESDRIPWLNLAPRLGAVLICGACAAGLLGWQMKPAAAQAAAPQTASVVLAQLGQQPITAAEVDFQLGRVARPGETLPELPAVVVNSTIDLIASQRQALATLRRSGEAVSEKEVDSWLESNSLAMATDEQPLTVERIMAQIRQQYGIEAQAYRDLVAFRLSWPAYIQKHMSDVNVEKHFGRQTARFDGSQFEIEMLSMPVSAGASAARSQAATELSAVRAEQEEQSADFDSLASSQRPFELLSRRWIRGTGDLDPRLIDSILQLQDGEISPPIHTATGVHLIRRLATRGGNRPLAEVKHEVRAHMLLFMLEYLAAQSRQGMPLTATR